MTKADIVNNIAKETSIDKTVILQVVDEMMGTIISANVKDEPVYLRGFGSFVLKQRAEKKARNITKNITIIVPPHQIPAFKPCAKFISDVKKQ